MFDSRISNPYPNTNKKPVLFSGPKKAPLIPKSKNQVHNDVEKAFRDRKSAYILNLEQLLARYARGKDGRRNGVRLISELRTRLDYRPNSLNKIEDLEQVRKAAKSPELIIMSRDPQTDKLVKREDLQGSSLDIFESDNQSSPASSVLQLDNALSPSPSSEVKDSKPQKRKRGRPKAIKEEPLSSPEPPTHKRKTSASLASQSGISDTFNLHKTGSNHSSPALLSTEYLWADLADEPGSQALSFETLSPPARGQHDMSIGTVNHTSISFTQFAPPHSMRSSGLSGEIRTPSFQPPRPEHLQAQFLASRNSPRGSQNSAFGIPTRSNAQYPFTALGTMPGTTAQDGRQQSSFNNYGASFTPGTESHSQQYLARQIHGPGAGYPTSFPTDPPAWQRERGFGAPPLANQRHNPTMTPTQNPGQSSQTDLWRDLSIDDLFKLN